MTVGSETVVLEETKVMLRDGGIRNENPGLRVRIFEQVHPDS